MATNAETLDAASAIGFFNKFPNRSRRGAGRIVVRTPAITPIRVVGFNTSVGGRGGVGGTTGGVLLSGTTSPIKGGRGGVVLSGTTSPISGGKGGCGGVGQDGGDPPPSSIHAFKGGNF
jgi:hypothetical protein